MFTFAVLDQKYPCKFCARNQNWQFKLKFGT